MNALAHVRRSRPRAVTNPAARAAIEAMTYELIPLKSLDDQIAHLPPDARVSVTASPVKTLEDSLDVCAKLLDLGHRPVPHLAARMVDDAAHVRALADRITRLGLREVFCIAGDHAEHRGYPDAMAFLQELLHVAAGDIDSIGVSGYPDGHTFIAETALWAAVRDKQALFAEAGVEGRISTQMCFSTDTIRDWLTALRREGITLPVDLGVAGVVDRTRLMTMGMRLGVGASLRYLQKNRAGLVRLFATAGYNPATLIDPLAADFDRLGIEGLHVFTFNQVAATRQWQQHSLA